MLLQPHTAAKFRIALRYLRTETEGPLFERMKAKLAGIASHSGMSGVFVLRGADVYRVPSLERVPGRTLPPPPSAINMLSALRVCTQGLAKATDLDQLIDEALTSLERHCDIRHAMLLMFDGPGKRLYTVASRGYDTSGVGSEIAMGDGLIGVCARERTPIRLTHTTSDYVYGRAIRESAALAGFADRIETEIPFPGLAAPGSQLAVPLVLGNRLLGGAVEAALPVERLMTACSMLSCLRVGTRGSGGCHGIDALQRGSIPCLHSRDGRAGGRYENPKNSVNEALAQGASHSMPHTRTKAIRALVAPSRRAVVRPSRRRAGSCRCP